MKQSLKVNLIVTIVSNKNMSLNLSNKSTTTGTVQSSYSRYKQSRKQTANRTTLNLVNGLAHHKFLAQWIERPSGVWEVMNSTTVGDSGFFSLSHARDMMNIPSFIERLNNETDQLLLTKLTLVLQLITSRLN